MNKQPFYAIRITRIFGQLSSDCYDSSITRMGLGTLAGEDWRALRAKAGGPTAMELSRVIESLGEVRDGTS